MTKEQIISDKKWQYISSLKPEERYYAITQFKANIENEYNVKIEDWPFTRLPEVTDDMVTISVTDRSINVAFMFVLIPQ